MDSLPNELLFSICSSLKTTEDVKTFRRMGKSCAAVGLEYLIPSISVVLTHASLARFNAITSHPILRQHVVTLKLYVDVVPAFPSKSKWMKHANLTDETATTAIAPKAANGDTEAATNEPEMTAGNTKTADQDDDKETSDEKLRRRSTECYKLGWKHHAKLRKEQQNILESNAHAYCLRAGMPLLQSLSSVEITRTSPYNKDALAMLFRPSPADNFYVSNLLCDRQSFTRVNVDMFSAVTSSLRLGYIDLDELHVHCFSWRMFMPPNVGYPEPESPHTFISLLSFEYSWQHYPEENEYDADLSPSKIDASANNLHDFLSQGGEGGPDWISLRFDQSLDSHLMNTKAILQDTMWESLSILNLQGVRITGAHFIDFLKRHSGQLDSLTMEYVWLDHPEIDNDWVNFFKLIGESPDISIDSFVVAGSLFSESWPSFEPERPVWTWPEIDVGRAVRYLVCGKKTDNYDDEDAVSKEVAGWESINFDCLDEGYDEDEDR